MGGLQQSIMHPVLAISTTITTTNTRRNNHDDRHFLPPPDSLSSPHHFLNHNINENQEDLKFDHFSNNHNHHHHHRLEEEEEEGLPEEEEEEDEFDDEGSNNNANNNNSDKRLVIFIGPKKSGSSSVEKFFYTHAGSGNGHGGLNGWIWPTYPNLQIDGVPPHKVFSLYIEKPKKDKLLNKLDHKIIESWEYSTNGIIIGSELFDRIYDDDDDEDRKRRNTGHNNNNNKKNNNNHNNNNNNNHNGNNNNDGAYTHGTHKVVTNAVVVLEHLQDILEITPEQITIVLNYRTPRIDQWVSLFSHHTHETEEEYRHFLCNGHTSQAREELLATTMNPFGISQTIINKLNYDVVMVDMAGTSKHNIEISHAILCHVLLERTTDGCNGDDVNLDELNAVFEEDHLEDHDSIHDTFNEQKQSQLDQLFLERDCYYKDILEDDPKFTILYQDQIWKTCSDDPSHKESYANLADGDTMLYAIQAQKNCADHFMKADEVNTLLVGNNHHQTTTTTTTQQQQQQQVAEQQSEENVLNVMEKEPMIGGDGSEIFGKDSSLSFTFQDKDAPIITGIFVLIAVGIGFFSLIVGGRRIMARRRLKQHIQQQQQQLNLDGGGGGGSIEFSRTMVVDNRNIV